MNSRTEIANSLTDVPGIVRITPYVSQSSKPGTGFVRLAQRRRAANGFGWINDWEVWIITPQDLAAAERWLEANVDGIADSLNSVMTVNTITPSELVIGSNTISGVIFAGYLAA